MSATQATGFGQRCRQHAASHPDRPAIVYVGHDSRHSVVTWRGLDQLADGFAHALKQAGADQASLIIVSMPDSPEHFAAALGAWRLGACVLPINPAMPERERDQLLTIASSWREVVLVGELQVDGYACLPTDIVCESNDIAIENIEETIPQPGKAIGSGGSTGRPKIIVDPKPWSHVPGKWGLLNRVGLKPGQVQLVAGRLYHNVGFHLGHIGLFERHTLIVTPRFDPEQAVELIRTYKVQFMGIIPIMMQRIAKLPGLSKNDFSSLKSVYHAGASCPEWVKRKWLDLVDPIRLWEIYGATEEKGMTAIRGDEWLQHPGSVGRPYQSEIRIVGEAGQHLAVGEVGQIYLRNTVDPTMPVGATWPQEPTSVYVGTGPLRESDEGFVSVGDMGHVDSNGYLYLADRRVDLIVSGGANVYPAEVESILSEHPGVADVVVIGLVDSEWGHRVHAVVEPVQWSARPEAEELNSFCRARISAYKAPKSYEFLQLLPRDPSGKISRGALREARNDLHQTHAAGEQRPTTEKATGCG